MINIKNKIDSDILKKIFRKSDVEKFYKIYTGNKFIDKKINVWEYVSSNWDYQKAKIIIQEMYRNSAKFLNEEKGFKNLIRLINDYKNTFKNEEIKWPCHQSQFDKLAQRINTNKNLNSQQKDELIAKNAIQFRRVKEINTIRHDYIENLIIDYSDNIIPTLKHSAKSDIFINGDCFDLKVAKIQKTSKLYTYLKKESENITYNDSQKIGVWLYEQQGADRFDSSPRIFLVILDEEISPGKIKNSIIDSKFESKTFENIPFVFKTTKEHKEMNYEATFKMIIFKK